MALDAVPDVGRLDEVRVSPAATPRGAGRPGIDPRADRGIVGECSARGTRGGVASGSMTLRTCARPSARTADRPSRLPAIGSFGMVKPVNSVTVSGIPRRRGSIVHCPSSRRGSQPVAIAAAYATCRPTTGRVGRCAGRRSSCARAASSGGRIDDRQRVVKRAGELVQRAHHQHAALAVPDQHRRHAVVLVVPRERAGELRAVGVAAVRVGAVARIAQPSAGIAHRDRKCANGSIVTNGTLPCSRTMRGAGARASTSRTSAALTCAQSSS